MVFIWILLEMFANLFVNNIFANMNGYSSDFKIIKPRARVGIYHDTRVARKDGLYPVKLRVTYMRYTKFYSTKDKKLAFSKEDFNKIMGERPREQYKESRRELNRIEEEADKIIREIESNTDFSFSEFERRFLGKGMRYDDVFQSIQEHINILEAEGKYNTASTYRGTLFSLMRFNHCESSSLSFSKVTPDFLSRFEEYMLNAGRKITTVSIYTRCIMRIFNAAINAGDIPKSLYPFGRTENGLYTPPQHENAKRALSKPDVIKIITHPCKEGSPEQFYRDLWSFSYLANGMNVNDILRLKYSNIHDGEIWFEREKVKHQRKTRQIIVYITPELQSIIDRWGQKPVSENSYIFPVLYNDYSPKQVFQKIRQTIKQCNKYSRRIAKAEGIEANVTTYMARHSFATVLKNSGESVAFISESLGHSDVSTTQNYLSSFDKEKRAEAARKLI